MSTLNKDIKAMKEGKRKSAVMAVICNQAIDLDMARFINLFYQSAWGKLAAMIINLNPSSGSALILADDIWEG